MATHVGNLIRKKRLGLGLTQKQVAKLIKVAGPMFISQVEGGVSKAPLARVRDICRALGIDKHDIYYALLEDYKLKLNQALKVGS